MAADPFALDAPPAPDFTPAALPAAPATPQRRAFGDTAAIRTRIFDQARAAAQQLAPAQHRGLQLRLLDVDYEGPEHFSVAQQKRAVLTGQTLGRRLRGTWELADQDGNVKETRRATLATVPYLTDRGTYVLNGTEYTLAHQLRLRPGVYTRQKENGELESHFNILPGSGRAHRLALDPETGVFQVQVGQARLPLISLLKTLGVSDPQLREAWGNELYAANAKKDNAQAATKLAAKFLREQPADGNIAAALTATISAMPLDPDVTTRTLGQPYSHLEPAVYLAAAKKLLAVHRGEADSDDRDHLAFQQAYGPERLFAERLRMAAGEMRHALWRAATRGLKALQPGNFDKPLRAALLTSGLGQPNEAINPAMLFEQQGRISRLGEGGIPSIDAIPVESHGVQPSQYGFVDAVWSPESEKAGVDSRLAANVEIGDDDRLYSPFRNVRTGKIEHKSPQDLADLVVGFPNSRQARSSHVPAFVQGQLRYVPKQDIDYELQAFEHAFNPISNLVPMKSAMKGQRAAMAGRMITQALPLKNPEAPLVRSGVPGEARSYDELFGEQMGALRAPQGGLVLQATPDEIVIRQPDGQIQRHELSQNVPNHRKTLFHQTPVVQAGPQLQPGALLARSNYTDQQGSTALGLNVRTAYLPFRGSVAADTHVLWYQDGQPKFTPVCDVRPVAGLAALATDPAKLQTQVLPAAGFIAHRATKMLRITTSSGRILRATPVHSFVVLGATGELVECAGSELVAGKSKLPRLGKVELPVTVTEVVMKSVRSRTTTMPLDYDFGFICGFYIAEGCRSNRSVSFAATDPVLREYFRDTVQRAMPHSKASLRHKNYVSVGEARLCAWLVENCGHRAQRKRIPDVAFGAPLEFRRGLLAGYWVGDGRVSSKGNKPTDTDVICTSRRLRDGLGLLLASLGISTTHGEYHDAVTYSEGVAYRLGVSTRDTHKFPALPHTVKGKRLLEVAASYKATGMAEHIPVPAGAAIPYRNCAKKTDHNTYSRIAYQVKNGSAARRDVLRLVPEDARGPLGRLRQMAAADLEWDTVVDIIEETGDEMVYDFDMAPLRTFVCIDTLVVHNSNYEDAYVISDSLARRMTSEHMYQEDFDFEDNQRRGTKEYLALFPGKLPRQQLRNYDPDGVIKVGTTVNEDDPLILAGRRKETVYGLLRRRHEAFEDASRRWTHHTPGIVTDVERTDKGAVVTVKAYEPMTVGSKLCYDDQTEVLTTAGWKPIQAVSLQDECASLNQFGELEYLQPAALHRYPHAGRMYRIVTTQVDLLVTENHALYARLGLSRHAHRYHPDYSLIEAQQLYRHAYRLKRDARWTGQARESVTLPAMTVRAGQSGRGQRQLPAITVPMHEYLVVLGLFISHGTTFVADEARPGSGGTYGFDLHLSDPEQQKQVVEQLRQFGLRPNRGKQKIRVYSKQWQQHFAKFGLRHQRCLPPWVFELPAGQLSLLYAWLLYACGQPATMDVYHTTAKQLADDLQRLTLHIGLSANVCQKGGGRTKIKGHVVDCRPTWLVRVYASKNHPTINGDVKRQDAWVQYSGDVYCVTLPRNHVLYVRRNGKPVWCGNSGRMGDKGVVSMIVPDAEMPKDRQGRPFELLANPIGINKRANPAQVIEAWLGKIAEKTGRPYTVHDFDQIEDLAAFAQQELEKHGIPDREDVVDPDTGVTVPNVLTGNRFIMKLHHTSESKAQGRGTGGYTMEGSPAKSQDGDSSKRLAMMQTTALLSHGAPALIKDALLNRGQQHPEFWQRFMAGHPPATAGVPMRYRKFVDQLRASGINPVREGEKIHLMALTDQAVDELAGDRELTNAATVDWDKELRPVTGGLFDPQLVGGNRWAAIKLHEPLPNPAFEEPIRKVLGLTQKQFEATLAGRHQLQGRTGPAAIREALSGINLEREIAQARQTIQSGRKTARDDAVRRLRYLASAQQLGLHPRDWVLRRAPVLPPTFRPIAAMGSTGLPLVADANYLYKDLIEANQNLAEVADRVDDVGEERLALYHAFKAVAGLGDPITQRSRDKKVRGILEQVSGSSPKFGSVQRSLLSGSVDLVGRAVIVPDQDLDMDEVGLPEDKAWNLYQPFVVRRLVRRGMPRMRAVAAAKERDKVARAALLEEMSARPVLIDRAPVLHRYGIMAFWPKLTQGAALRVTPFMTAGAGADFDGNCVTFSTEILTKVSASIYAVPGAAEFVAALEETAVRLTGNTLIWVQESDGEKSALLRLPIGEFPRVGTPQQDRKGAAVYAVPAGLTIQSYDHATGRVGWYPITHFTVDRHHTCVAVATARNRRVEVSDNESLAVFCQETGALVKTKPAAALGALTPIVVTGSHAGDQWDWELGWLYGALVADGWYGETLVGYAKNEPEKREAVVRILREQIAETFTEHTYHDAGDHPAKYAASAKIHLYGRALRDRMLPITNITGGGRQALYKIIPPQLLLGGSRDCLLGLLCGLLDGDGCFKRSTGGTNKAGGILANIYTSSSQLVSDVQELCRRIGIRSSVTTTAPRNKSKASYTVSLSLLDLAAIAHELRFVGKTNQHFLKEFRRLAPLRDSRDIVPITRGLAAALAVVATPKNGPGCNLYAALCKARTTGYLGRQLAVRAIAQCADCQHQHFAAFRRLVENTAVHWDTVKSVTPLPRQDVFDLAVPGTKVFMIANGLIVYDTMNYHVPFSDEAVEEAKQKLLPSKNLLSPATFRVHQFPGKEFQGGLYSASTARDPNKRPVRFATAEDAIAAFKRGDLSLDQPVVIGG